MRNKVTEINIHFVDISNYRRVLMGFAMICVIFFHINSPIIYPLFGLCKSGDVGVDIFLFLSGVGLWFSWTKTPSFKVFYKRRFLRIVPTWLFFSSLYYLSHYFYHYFKGDNLMSLKDVIGQITINWDFWRIGDCTFWFIPCLLVLYLFAPLYIIVIQNHAIFKWLPILFVFWGIAVGNIAFLMKYIGHLSIFWNRIPIFLLGINLGHWVKSGMTIGNKAGYLVVFSFFTSLSLSYFCKYGVRGAIPNYYEYILYIPLSISTILLLCLIFRNIPEHYIKQLDYIGAFSLEYYLIHQNFVLIYFPYRWHYCFSFILCILITTSLVWLYTNYIKNNVLFNYL